MQKFYINIIVISLNIIIVSIMKNNLLPILLNYYYYIMCSLLLALHLYYVSENDTDTVKCIAVFYCKVQYCLRLATPPIRFNGNLKNISSISYFKSLQSAWLAELIYSVADRAIIWHRFTSPPHRGDTFSTARVGCGSSGLSATATAIHDRDL